MTAQSRAFRVFVSSTFSDLKAERNALQTHVFPRLRELCEKHGARFQVIDLRWGVSEEASLDQQAMNICLGEIARCQKTTPRPNFIVLLGDRYGWRPPPPQIPAPEFEEILYLITNGERELLNTWYRRDDNAVPAEYCLEPRQRGGDCEEYAAWEPVERRLHETLKEAIEGLDLDEDQRLKYEASATHQEIAAGALKVEDAPEHVLCFFRRIEGLPQDRRAEGFLDLVEVDGEREPDGEAQARLEDLKGQLSNLLPANVRRYEANWATDGPTTDHIDQLCEDVFACLSRIILAEIEHPQEIAAEEEKPVHIQPHEALGDEGRAHHKFAEERLAFFVGREKILEEIDDYRAAVERRILVIAGGGGTGKSALMAKAIEKTQRTHPHSQAQIVYRFIGATPGSSDGRSLLASLCRELSRRYGADESDIPIDYNDLVPELSKRMGLASPDKPLILFLDSLDQLSASQGARSLIWLPTELPEHVSLVASTRNEEDTYQNLKAKPIIEKQLAGLEPDEGASLLDQWLESKSVQRTLQSAQREEVLKKFAQSDCNPLYLKLAFEEARLWTSHQSQEELAVGVQGIIQGNMIGRLKHEGKHGEMLVSHALGYLAASRYGLAEDELVDLLSRDLEVYERFFRQTYHVPSDLLQLAIEHLRKHPELLKNIPRSSPNDAERVALGWLRQRPTPPESVVRFLKDVLTRADGPRLPIVLWSRLSFDLASYLTERMVDGSSLLSFYHRELGDVSKAACLAGDQAQAYHGKLADYFRFKADPTGDRSWKGGNIHGLSELPFHLTEAAEWDQVYDILTDFRFLESKAGEVGVLESQDADGRQVKTYTGVFQLQEDYDRALAAMPGEGGSGSGGGEHQLIVTAVDRGEGLTVYCPVCNQTSPIEKGQLDRVITCPNPGCDRRLKINPSVTRMA